CASVPSVKGMALCSPYVTRVQVFRKIFATKFLIYTSLQNRAAAESAWPWRIAWFNSIMDRWNLPRSWNMGPRFICGFRLPKYQPTVNNLRWPRRIRSVKHETTSSQHRYSFVWVYPDGACGLRA